MFIIFAVSVTCYKQKKQVKQSINHYTSSYRHISDTLNKTKGINKT